MRRILFVSLLIVALAAGLAAQAVGKPGKGNKPQRVRTTTTATEVYIPSTASTEGVTDFEGKVSSPKGICKKGRKVVLLEFKLTPAGGESVPAGGRTRTKANGKWAFSKQVPPSPRGRSVRIEPKRVGRVLCKGTERGISGA